MFSPRTHRRQNSAETSYQKGKSPSSLPTVFFSLPRFIHCCYRRRGNFLAATARRGTKLFDVFSFFCICCCATRKETIFHTFHRWIRSGIILFTNGFSRMEFHSLIFPCCSSYLCTSATNCIFESYQRSWETRHWQFGVASSFGQFLLYQRWDLSGAHFLRIRVDYAHLWKETGLCYGARGGQRRIDAEWARIDRDSSIFRGWTAVFSRSRGCSADEMGCLYFITGSGSRKNALRFAERGWIWSLANLLAPF